MSSLTQARVEGRRRIYLARHADVTYFSTATMEKIFLESRDAILAMAQKHA